MGHQAGDHQVLLRHPRGRGMGVWLRSPRGGNRGPLLCDLVQRVPWSHHRRSLDRRFRDLPSGGERLPAVQPQRRTLPQEDRRPFRDAVPSFRHRPYGLRRHLLQRVAGPRVLGTPSARDGAGPVRGERLAVHEDRRRPRPDRDLRRLAPPLSRRPPFLQRLCLCIRQRPAGPRAALESACPQRPVPHQPARVLRTRGRCAQRDLPLRRPA